MMHCTHNSLLKTSISQYPIRYDSGDFNWYRYVGNSPLVYGDALGEAGYNPNGEYCLSLMKRIKNIQKSIQRAYENLDKNKLGLPRIKSGGKPSESIKGHDILLTIKRRQYYKLIDEYDDKCRGGGSSQSTNSTCNSNIPEPPWWWEYTPILAPIFAIPVFSF